MTHTRPADPTDTDAIAELLAEMDAFYGATDLDPVEVRTGQIRAALFSSPPAAHALLAWDADTLAGIASYSFLWPAVGLTKSLYLKELYVAQAHRRKDTGGHLMRAVIDQAVKHGCSRVEWTTDTDNATAISFYQALRQTPHPSKIFYRLEGADLLRTAE